MNALEMTKLAYEKNEVSKLLLGASPYVLSDRFVPLPKGVSTDLVAVLTNGLYKYKIDNPYLENKLVEALNEILNSHLGIWTVACFIMLESDTRTSGESPLTLDLNQIANNLKSAIVKNKDDLFNEKICYDGNLYPNGLLGELQRLSLIAESDKGPNFFPEELNKKTTS